MQQMTPLRTLTIAILMLAVACGGDAETAPMVTSIPPTSTPYVSPTSTPVVDVSSLVGRELLGLERLREFPEELKSGSPPLDRKEAAEIARVFRSDTRVVGSDSMIDFCSDGTGLVILWRELPDFEGTRFRWEIQPNPAGRWNKPRVAVSYDDQIGDSWPFDERDEVFDHPTCGQ